ncbi:MAG: Holliday junction branch migration protein RuvA [Desulfovermiculus sp.]|nr:Holliday junction branch migration protein RuvA [Desulfovermiculus sp.]
MIGYLHGTLLEARSTSCLLLTPGGVGYTVQAAGPVLERLPQPGQELSLYVHTVVREDALELYGFPSRAEQETFVQLIAVSKLGPKTALAILAVFDPQELSHVVHTEDIQALTRVPGIGPKSAKRVIWELKDKLLAAPASSSEAGSPVQAEHSIFSDALAGLTHLGYTESEVRPVLLSILEEDPEMMAGEAIRAVLKRMARAGES